MTINRVQPIFYRCYGDDDELLYIGLSENLPTRLRGHSRVASWWTEVKLIRLEKFSTYDELMAAERVAIKMEHPKHNVVYKGLGSQVELNDDVTEVAERLAAARVELAEATAQAKYLCRIMFAAGVPVARIARDLGITVVTVHSWRKQS